MGFWGFQGLGLKGEFFCFVLMVWAYKLIGLWGLKNVEVVLGAAGLQKRL